MTILRLLAITLCSGLLATAGACEAKCGGGADKVVEAESSTVTVEQNGASVSVTATPVASSTATGGCPATAKAECAAGSKTTTAKAACGGGSCGSDAMAKTECGGGSCAESASSATTCPASGRTVATATTEKSADADTTPAAASSCPSCADKDS